MTDSALPPANLFYVVFQTGGRLNFKWHRSLPMGEEEAEKSCETTRRMGYAAMVVNVGRSDAIGLPDTYDAPEIWEYPRAEGEERTRFCATNIEA